MEPLRVPSPIDRLNLKTKEDKKAVEGTVVIVAEAVVEATAEMVNTATMQKTVIMVHKDNVVGLERMALIKAVTGK